MIISHYILLLNLSKWSRSRKKFNEENIQKKDLVNMAAASVSICSISTVQLRNLLVNFPKHLNLLNVCCFGDQHRIAYL